MAHNNLPLFVYTFDPAYSTLEISEIDKKSI